MTDHAAKVRALMPTRRGKDHQEFLSQTMSVLGDEIYRVASNDLAETFQGLRCLFEDEMARLIRRHARETGETGETSMPGGRPN